MDILYIGIYLKNEGCNPTSDFDERDMRDSSWKVQNSVYVEVRVRRDNSWC